MDYVIGIDLGTTNCAVAFAPLSGGSNARIHDFHIPQLHRPGQVPTLPLLPSALYVPNEHELPPDAARLPWGDSPRFIAGAFARWQGARVPGRLVSSAKSWLSHSGVDRSAPILPWGAPAEVPKVSPVQASTLLLQHMAAAWDHAHPEAPAARQEIVITVPASFDEVARTLTVDAARQAGFERFTLVEEPQAAFYDFTANHQRDLNAALNGARLILVIDVGGGTTDFTLIQASVENGAPSLRRIAVGDHLMLGGDNMDAALARHAEERIAAGGRKLSAAQWNQLVQAAREAKEALLGATPGERHTVAVAGEGSRLLGGSLSVEITRADAERLILDGFFPQCAPVDAPRRGARTALQELGLPYAQDPAVSRHLAAFLRQHAAACHQALGTDGDQGVLPRPDALLFNGGVFNSAQISRRIIETLNGWWPSAPPVFALPHASLEFAVARGAVAHGLARRGVGPRISGGSAHALYIGLAPEKSGAAPRAICLIPRGHEEGQPVDLTSQTFELTLGRPVQFPVFSSQAERADKAGDVVEVTEEFHALPPIHTLFQAGDSRIITSRVVHLRGLLTDLGAVELSCVANVGGEQWKLEFDVRGAASQPPEAPVEAAPPKFAEALALIEQAFGKGASANSARDAKQLWRSLEKVLGPRDQWRLPLLREVWNAMFTRAKNRLRSADHERTFFQVIGYTLRPGYGYPLDDWRCEQTFQLFHPLVKHHGEQPVWSEFWILWRRIAGGLSEARHREIWEYLQPHLERRIPPDAPKPLPKIKGLQPEGLDEMLRTAASLEHLDAAQKAMLGNWIAERLRSQNTAASPSIWALGRLGTRAPLYGSGHRTVDAETATAWVQLLIANGLRSQDGSAFAAAQIARLTGDRTRDLDGDVRAQLITALTALNAPAAWIQMLTEVVSLQAADQARALGDSLPIGLRLRHSG